MLFLPRSIVLSNQRECAALVPNWITHEHRVRAFRTTYEDALRTRLDVGLMRRQSGFFGGSVSRRALAQPRRCARAHSSLNSVLASHARHASANCCCASSRVVARPLRGPSPGVWEDAGDRPSPSISDCPASLFLERADDGFTAHDHQGLIAALPASPKGTDRRLCAGVADWARVRN